MSQGGVIDQIREGMEVLSSDGQKLGKIKNIWYGAASGMSSAYSDEESCIEVRSGGLFSKETLYIPFREIVDVSGNNVKIKADAQAVHKNPAWHTKPSWIGQ